MTFREASEKLDGLADGKYHSIQYEKATSSDKRIEETCSLYIGGNINWHTGETWEEAFGKLHSAMFDQAPE